jgi:ubiquinone biosynthesis protein UbiJ
VLPNPLLITLNKILSHNQGSLSHLKKYQGKSFTLNVAGINLAATIDSDGLLIPSGSKDYSVTILVPLATATYLLDQDKLEAFKKIIFTGDKHFGRDLLEILSNLHLAGIYEMQLPFGNFLLKQLSAILIRLKITLKLLAKNATTSVAEYLLYESEDIAERYEIEQFCNDVDELKSQLDRLTQRINLLATK